ncbi:acyl carrier protein [bacterium]|nr:acyl carrier protein [bacterium]
MTDVEIISLVNDSLIEEFELDESAMVSEAEIFADLGLDSLDIVDMVVVLEGLLEIKIRDDEGLREIRTLGDIHRFVITKKRETETAAD